MKKVALPILLLLTGFLEAQFVNCKEDLFPVRDQGKKQYGYVTIFGEWKIPAFYDQAREFREGIAVVSRKSKFGIVSCEGKVILTCDYDEIQDFVNGYAWVKKNEFWGMIDRNGKFVLECVYEKVENISKFNDLAWLKTKGKWGVFDKENLKFIHAPQFDDYLQLSDEYSLVELDGKKGMINHLLTTKILEPEYESIEKFAPYLLAYRKDGKVGVIRDNGRKILAPEYQSVKNLGQTRFAAEKNGQYGVWDVWGRPLTAVILDSVAVFSDNVALFKKDNSYGFLNLNGKLIWDKYEYATSFKNGIAQVVKQGLGTYLINPKGITLSDAFEKIVLHNGYFVALMSQNTKKTIYTYSNPKEKIADFDAIYGGQINKLRVKTDLGVQFYDATKKALASPLFFTAVEPWFTPYFTVLKGEGVGVLDTNLNLIIEPIYDNQILYSHFGNPTFGVFKGGKTAIFNLKGKAITDFYEDVSVVNDKNFIAVQNKKYGVVTDKRSSIIPFKYTEIIAPESVNGKYTFPLIVRLKTKYGLLDKFGNTIVPIKFSKIEYLENGIFALYSKEKQVSIIDYKGDEILKSPMYFVERAEENGLLLVVKDNKFGLMDRNGELKTTDNFDVIYPFCDNYAVIANDNLYGIIGKSGVIKISTSFTDLEMLETGYLLKKGNKTLILNFTGEINQNDSNE